MRFTAAHGGGAALVLAGNLAALGSFQLSTQSTAGSGVPQTDLAPVPSNVPRTLLSPGAARKQNCPPPPPPAQPLALPELRPRRQTSQQLSGPCQGQSRHRGQGRGSAARGRSLELARHGWPRSRQVQRPEPRLTCQAGRRRRRRRASSTLEATLSLGRACGRGTRRISCAGPPSPPPTRSRGRGAQQ